MRAGPGRRPLHAAAALRGRGHVKPIQGEQPSGAPYPLFLLLQGQRALVVGGGAVALRKARALWESGCQLTVVSSRFSDRFRAWLASHPAHGEERPYADGEAAAFFLVVCATDDPSTNQRVYEDARRAQRLVNVVDQPHLCNFFVPSVLRRGALQVAVSTSGDCPALSRRVREELEPLLPERYGPLLERLAAFRGALKRRLPTAASRKRALEEALAGDAVTRFLAGDDAPLDERLGALLDAASRPAHR